MTIPADSLLNDGEGEFTVYVPKGGDGSGPAYPVLYLFHGMNGDHMAWEEKGRVVEMTDSAIRAGVIRPFIIVMPNAYNSFFVDGFYLLDGEPGNKYETFFFTRLVPYIEANYPVMKDRAHTAVAGLSMGGYGASLYAFKYPGKFCFSYSMSGATEGLDWIWSEDDEDLVPSIPRVFETKGYKKEDFGNLPAYFMDCGTEDIICKGFNDMTHEYLRSIKFPHEFREYEGEHEWEYWTACYRRMLPDLSRHFDK